METIYYVAASAGPTTADIWFWIGVGGLAIGYVGSEFAPWKSATLSPESIKRRFYWAGASAFVVCLALSQMPDVRAGVAGACIFFLGFVTIAFFRSSHIKIGGRIIAARPLHRRPGQSASSQPGRTTVMPAS